VKLSRVLTDRGTEYCGNPEHHDYELYLAVEDIDHSRTKTKSPQTNGIVERLHKTMLNEFYRIAFRKKLYTSIGAPRNAVRLLPRPWFWAGCFLLSGPQRQLLFAPPPRIAELPEISWITSRGGVC
jgi:transposase InsO family protein